jgi:hypothetical protein
MLYTPGDGKALTEFMSGRGFTRLGWSVDFGGSCVVSNLLATRGMKPHLARLDALT